MKKPSPGLLVLFHHELIFEKEEKYLRRILAPTESPEQFSIAYELVDRNRVTADKKKIIKASSRKELKPFRFLLNKN